MLRNLKRRLSITLAAVLAVACVWLPATANAKSVVIKMSLNASGTTLTGTASGTFGSGRVNGKLTIPTSKYTIKFRRGTVKVSARARANGGKFRGTWRFTGGTGRYKGIKGGGSLTGNTRGQFTLKGKY